MYTHSSTTQLIRNTMLSPPHVSLALDAVCKASDEEIRHHRTKAQVVLQRLQSLLCTPYSLSLSHDQNGPSAAGCEASQTTSTGSPLSVRTGAEVIPYGLQPPSVTNQQPSTNNEPQSSSDQITAPLHQIQVGLPPHAALIDKLQGKHRQIETFLRQKATKSVIEEPISKDEDPRVHDIRTCDRPRVTKEQQFLRTLGQRSLAKDFDRWFLGKYGRSRVEELVETLSSTENGSGRIRTFVRETFAIQDESVAARGIAHGIRLLVIEKLTGFCGTSALLCFVFADVRDLRYSSCADLATLLATCHDTRLYELASEVSKWLDTLQDIYNEKRRYEHSCRKRRRLNDEEDGEFPRHRTKWNGQLAAVMDINSEEPRNKEIPRDTTSIKASRLQTYANTSVTLDLGSQDQHDSIRSTSDQQSQKSDEVSLSRQSLPGSVSRMELDEEHSVEAAQNLQSEAYSMPSIMGPEILFQDHPTLVCSASSRQGHQLVEMSKFTSAEHETLSQQLMTPPTSISMPQSEPETQQNWHFMPSIMQSVDDVISSPQLMYSMPSIMQPEPNEDSEQYLQRFMQSFDSWEEPSIVECTRS